MLDAVLEKRGFAFGITVKGAVALLAIVLSVALPQIVHAAGGTQAAAVWMPMFAPTLLAGCILGWRWGLFVGMLSPLASFCFTALALDAAMPSASRLPYYILELTVYGLVCGAFTEGIKNNRMLAFPAVLSAQLCGRLVYLAYNLIAGRDFASLWSSVQTGLTGLYLQAAIVPLLVIALAWALARDGRR